MKGKVVMMCAIVAVLGIISAVAGFAAEATRVKISEVRIEQFSCVYPSSPAFGLGILAAVFALITRITLLVLAGCVCCCRPSGSTSTPVSTVFNIFSCIASVIALFLLFGGAALNNRQGGQLESDGTITCYVVRSGILAAGGVLSLLSAVFGIVAYVSMSSAKQTRPQLEFALPVSTNVDRENKVRLPPTIR